MSSTTLFLLRLKVRKKPMPRPGRLRVLSPPGGSILITSAPRSARIIPHVGPMTMCVNSMTRTPSSGSGRGVGDVASCLVGALIGSLLDEPALYRIEGAPGLVMGGESSGLKNGEDAGGEGWASGEGNNAGSRFRVQPLRF